ncbi:MAG: cyclic nucleotide-binding domain-containing protein [Candidatus Brocadiae bacterium]|nr:cyclic nucleotide-binding domain-containing protein [Candidatus Brocadiia bacterium]
MDFSERLLPILKKIPLFQELDENQHREIIKNIDTQYFKKDQVIFEKGDQANALYIIKSGKILIYQPGLLKQVAEEIAFLSDNDFFGEMGLVTHEPRNASAKTLEDSLLFFLTKDDFQKLLAENSAIASLISEEFIKRFKHNTKRVKKQDIKNEPGF